jgi:hypothetical protein
MTNLSNLNNIYADLAQSSYHNREKNFPYDTLDKEKQERLDAGKSVKIDYGKPVGKVYLQPDPTVKTIQEQPAFPLVNAPATINSYQKGLLTDEKAA